MKVKELLDVVPNPTMLRIMRGKEDLYTGYKGVMHYEQGNEPEWMEEMVKGFAAVPEIRHRKYREKGLMEPLLPEEMPQYYFRDLMITLYYTITI